MIISKLRTSKTKHFVLIIFIIAVIWFYYQNSPNKHNDQSNSTKNAILEKYHKQAPLSIASKSPLSFRSDSSSDDKLDLTIVTLFFDFQCKECMSVLENLFAIQKQNPRFEIIVELYPLSQTCNQHVKFKGNSSSCSYSSMVLCSDNSNSTFMLLFEQLKMLNPLELAQRDSFHDLQLISNKLEEEIKQRFIACNADSKNWNHKITDTQIFTEHKLPMNLPLVLIGGRPLYGSTNRSALREAINEAIDLKSSK